MNARDFARQEAPKVQEVREAVLHLRQSLQEARGRMQSVRETLELAGQRVMPMNYADPGVDLAVDRASDCVNRCALYFTQAEDAINTLATEVARLMGYLAQLEETGNEP